MSRIQVEAVYDQFLKVKYPKIHQQVKEWIKEIKDRKSLQQIWKTFVAKLRGHINYYRVSHNAENAEFFIAFSCKGRGLCPSCNTRTMVAAAAHLVESVIPIVPMRQWVISFPLRIRHYLLEHTILQDVLDIIVDEIRKTIFLFLSVIVDTTMRLPGLREKRIDE